MGNWIPTTPESATENRQPVERIQLESVAKISNCLILIVAPVILSFLRVHPLNATRGSTAVGRFKGEVYVLLRIEANDETGNIDQLLTNSDVPLSDEDSGMVNGFGESQFKDLRLQATLEEVFDRKTQNVIQLHLRLVQNPDAHQTAQEGIAFE